MIEWLPQALRTVGLMFDWNRCYDQAHQWTMVAGKSWFGCLEELVNQTSIATSRSASYRDEPVDPSVLPA